MAASSRPTVTLSTLTFRRPDDIAATLPLLIEQARSVPHNVQVLVVDNDTTDSARGAVEDFAPDVRYVHEPKPGIPAARNRVLAESANSDLIVFFDDDERPSAAWLHHLLDLYERERPTGVVGPVVSEFSQEPDPWVASGANFVRVEHPTGSKVQAAATNNLLLDRSFLIDHGITFDERFSLTGGSDTMLTRQVTQAGGVLLWCDEAVVTAVIPASRLTRQWVTRRVFRTANCAIRVELELAGSRAGRLAVRVRSVGNGGVRIAGGFGQRLIGAAAADLKLGARGVRTLARGCGMVTAAFGYVYSDSEYSRAKSRNSKRDYRRDANQS